MGSGVLGVLKKCNVSIMIMIIIRIIIHFFAVVVTVAYSSLI